MRILRKLILPAVAVLTISGQAFSEETDIRLTLLEDKSVTALYTIDEFNTLVISGADGSMDKALESICSEYKGEMATDADTLRCEGVFTASRIDPVTEEGHSIVITTETAQPLAYKNESIPSVEDVTAPPSGLIEGEHSSIDMYQYMYALCKKNGGTPSVVLSKRFGKTARYTEVGAQEAFGYLMASGEGKDPWFFACEGENRFIVEKDYQHNLDGSNRFTFHPKRGLEWVDYVKAEDGVVAALDAR
ncbi:MAG: hypothetical protein IT362_10635 [Deltaproteobacteria bacterium]|nr:hypothetical protein [Deltaproteobacteria bacterium]